ncbi:MULTISPECIES: hypothetical protein [Pseudomonadota]|uniref:hypothetical protein n=1 Tax=Pseudomonadota TaxID=1224 RepID=UPI002604CB2E|nr:MULTISPECIES: hypothetical protein [Pseudomonadota]
MNEKLSEFEKWCYTAEDPNTKLPLLTHFYYRVCGKDAERFTEGVDLLEAAFAAGRRVGQTDG